MPMIKGALVLSLLFSAVPAAASSESSVKIKGYYREDGSYIKPRVIDPIKSDSAVFPSLSRELALRKKQITRYYEGKVVTAKVSFPASRKGIILNGSGLGRTNVDLFKEVSKHGSAVDKGEKAIITRFKINSTSIDIDINEGGYGHFGDMSWRVVAGIFTLGLSELRDWNRVRYQEGSRLRIQLGHEDPASIRPEEIDVEKFRQALAQEIPVNSVILENLEMGKDDAPAVKSENLLPALEKIMAMPDFYQKVPLENVKLSKDTSRLLSKAKKTASAKKSLKGREIRALNKGLLCALYPIHKTESKYNADNLNFQNIDGLLSLVFEQ